MSVRLNDAEWLRRQLGPDEYSSETSVRDAGEASVRDAEENPDATTDAGADEKPGGETSEAATNGGQPEQNAGGAWPGKLDRKVVIRFGGSAAAGIVIVVLGAMLLSGGGKPAGGPGAASDARAGTTISTVAPTPVAAEAAGADRPLSFTASANCPAGSTSAQTMDGSDPSNAFVCVRNTVDGQVIRIDLPKTYVITAISITPGWLGKDSSGRSQWEQHRVVTRVQYAFNDTEHTMVVQDTGNVHGDAVQPIKHVLASKITMLIRQTSRPQAETATPTPRPGFGPFGGGPVGGGLFGGPSTTPSSSLVRPPLLGGPATTDPVDATFAISALKIIGHEAI
ncbi:MAG: hypothetical protein J2P17_06280 [Mycobacterium sp.]|nr:hypothetical protein [Mycobacterium sp.]